MDAKDAIKNRTEAYTASEAKTDQTRNLCGNVVLQTSWSPRVLSSRVILGSGALSREKCFLRDGKMLCMIRCCQLCTVACRTDGCTVYRENYKREMGEGRKRLGEAPFGYK